MVSTRSRRAKAPPKPSSKNHKVSKKSLKSLPSPSPKTVSKPASNPKSSSKPSSKSQKSSKPLSPKVKPSISRVKQSSKSKPVSKSLPSKPPSGGSSKYPHYSSSQLADFKRHQEDLDSNKLPELKDMCRKNSMKVSGTKPELVERIADAMVLGVIPKCPHCGGGRPKLDPKTMTYHCAGYRDDVDFVNCHKTIPYSELKREPWQD